MVKVISADKQVSYKVVESTDQAPATAEKAGVSEHITKRFPKTQEGKQEAEKYVGKLEQMRVSLEKDTSSTK